MSRSAQMTIATLVLGVAAGGAPTAERRLFSFGTLTADAGNPTGLGGAAADPSMGFGGMSGGGMSGMPSFLMPQSTDPNTPMLSPEQDAQVSANSAAFVQSAVGAFLGKRELPPDEMKCIQANSGPIGANVGRMAEQFGLVMQKAFHIDIPLVPDGPSSSSLGSSGTSGNPFDLSSFGNSDSAGSVGSIADKILQQGKTAGAPVASPMLSLSNMAGAMAPAPAIPVTPKPNSETAQALAFFYNQGRRLQMLPGFSTDPSSSSGSSGFGSSFGGGMTQAMPMAMEMGVYMKGIVDNTKELVNTCIHSDAKEAFVEAGQRATSVSLIAGHMVANGADVVDEMSDMMQAYDQKNASRFGGDFGTVMRKIFLSNNTNGKLPEGLPSKAQMSNVSAGLLQGFFGTGTKMQLSLDKDPTHPINIDMQHCVEQNTPYFQQVYGEMMFLFGQRAAGAVPAAATAATATATTGSAPASAMQFGTTVAFTMMELPQALEKCGISEDQKDMIVDSVKSLGQGMHEQISLPQRTIGKPEIRDDFAGTVDKWAKGDWLNFGKSLGDLMQESAVKFYPKKYAIDANGMLRLQLQCQKSSASGLLTFMAFSLLMLTAVLAVKLRKSVFSLESRSVGLMEDEA